MVNFQGVKAFLSRRPVKIVLVLLLALLLLLLCYRVFLPSSSENAYTPTAAESKLTHLIERLEGVEGATVMITEKGGAVTGAVVLLEGNDGLLVRMRVVEIASSYLGVPGSAIAVYPS